MNQSKANEKRQVSAKPKRRTVGCRSLKELPKTGYVQGLQLVSSSTYQGILPFSLATLYRQVRDGEFPAPYRLGGNTVAFKVEEVRAWLDSRPHVEPEAWQNGKGKMLKAKREEKRNQAQGVPA